MGAKTSQNMKDALKLIREGKSAYAAAKITGVSRGGISKSPLYRSYMKDKNGEKK